MLILFKPQDIEKNTFETEYRYVVYVCTFKLSKLQYFIHCTLLNGSMINNHQLTLN